MQRMWRRMFAAVAGLLAVAGVSSAQSPPPKYLPQIPTAPVYGPVVPASGAGYARGAGAGPAAPVASQPAVPFGQFGPGCNNGCGSCKSDAGFIFGSCKSFFDPCGPKPSQGGLFHNKQRCGAYLFASPYGTGYNGCAYDSYLNH